MANLMMPFNIQSNSSRPTSRPKILFHLTRASIGAIVNKEYEDSAILVVFFYYQVNFLEI